MCRRASREGDPELLGSAGCRRERQSVNKSTRMELREEEINKKDSPSTSLCAGQLGGGEWKGHVESN